MNLIITVPKRWQPNNVKAINRWFDKIHKHQQKRFE